jgi:hypothetical protein
MIITVEANEATLIDILPEDIEYEIKERCDEVCDLSFDENKLEEVAKSIKENNISMFKGY